MDGLVLAPQRLVPPLQLRELVAGALVRGLRTPGPLLQEARRGEDRRLGGMCTVAFVTDLGRALLQKSLRCVKRRE